MKLSAVTIWYNPDSSSVENILTYQNFVEKVYIVDNSAFSNKELSSKIKNAVYIPNLSNKGIASALNTGCAMAFEDGFEWTMTMDQDSAWEKCEIEKMCRFVENPPDSSIKSFAPMHRNSIKSVIGEAKRKIEKKISENLVFPDKVMTSGNIISLSAWKEIGGFNEKLFIDEVDHEFCYRLLEKGFKICEREDISMIHTLGNVKKTFFPRPCKHSGVRLFYIFRNMGYIKENFPLMYRKHGYRKYMVYAVIQKIIELKLKYIFFIAQGRRAHKKGFYGPYSKK